MTSCLSGAPRLSPGLHQLHCTSSSLKIFSQWSVLVLSWGPTSEAWASAPSPLSPQWACKPLLSWEVLFGHNLCGQFSLFCLWSTCCCVPPRVSETPPIPTSEGISKCADTFSPSPLLPWDTDPCLKTLCLFFYPYLLPYLILRRLGLTFLEDWGLLPVFWRCSAGVVPHADVFLMYLWGGRWPSHFTPLPSWKSSGHLNTVLNRRGEGGHPCFVSEFTRRLSAFHLWELCWLWICVNGLYYVDFFSLYPLE